MDDNGVVTSTRKNPMISARIKQHPAATVRTPTRIPKQPQAGTMPTNVPELNHKGRGKFTR